MDEDKLAAKVHGLYISESDSDSGNSDLDELYEALRPPSISLKDHQQDVVKIEAFKVVCRKNNTLKRLYAKVNTKSGGFTSKSEKNFKFNASSKRREKQRSSKAKNVEENKLASLISNLSLQNKSKTKKSFVNNGIVFATTVKSHNITLGAKNNTQPAPTIEKSQNCSITKSRQKKSNTEWRENLTIPSTNSYNKNEVMQK